MTGTIAQPWTPPRDRASEEVELPFHILQGDPQSGPSTADEVSAAALAATHPAGSGGTMGINLMQKLAKELRGEMSDLRNANEKRMDKIQRELEIKSTKDTTKILNDDVDVIKMEIEEIKHAIDSSPTRSRTSRTARTPSRRRSRTSTQCGRRSTTS